MSLETCPAFRLLHRPRARRAAGGGGGGSAPGASAGASAAWGCVVAMGVAASSTTSGLREYSRIYSGRSKFYRLEQVDATAVYVEVFVPVPVVLVGPGRTLGLREKGGVGFCKRCWVKAEARALPLLNRVRRASQRAAISKENANHCAVGVHTSAHATHCPLY